MPDSDWVCPKELPDLRRVPLLGLDTETKDDGLAANMGSSWYRCGGHVAGVGVAWGVTDAESVYLPIKHVDTACFDKERVAQWLHDHIKAGCRFVTQGGMYDWGWLAADLGVLTPPSDQLEEIGALATMVDENRNEYNLDALCEWRDLPGKDEALLLEAGAAYGFHDRKRVKANLWRMPGRLVGPYGAADPARTLALFHSLRPVMEAEGTERAYRLEVDLLPMIMEMRRRGIRIDLEAAERNRDELRAEAATTFARLSELLRTELGIGGRVSIEETGQVKWMMAAFDKAKISYPRTPKTDVGSFTAGTTGWMHKVKHWLPQLIVRAEQQHNAAEKFLGNYILDYAHKGRLHSEVHPHRSDEGGTRSLRFAYSNPPLQQMTGREKKLAEQPIWGCPATPRLSGRIRGVFQAEPGEVWAKPDVSQQEYRLIVHYAYLFNCRGADRAVERYQSDPDTDFHNYVVEITGLERQEAKDTNFAKSYGTGIPHFAEMIDRPVEEAAEIYETYDRELPFVQKAFEYTQSKAERSGFIRLLDGARRHWSRWEPKWLSNDERGRGWGLRQKMNPCSAEEAKARTRDPEHCWYGKRLRRTDTKDAFNGLIQGGAARQTKLWMRDLWREGLVPLLQMHDELDISVPDEATGRRVKELGQQAVKLEVPVKVDIHYGRSWGDAKHAWSEELRV